MSVPDGRSSRAERHTQNVTSATPEERRAEGLRPGNSKNVIQNILYAFSMSDTRCSVSNTDRPPRSEVDRSQEIRKRRFSDAPGKAAPDAWNFEGPRAAELQRYA